ncbi:hypothetical protein CORC01_11533 [Colletotrichum orchidophilum]|uniref:Uncharacterized protein n=1 Tax=Colletotrichum orchidophilum TaxID=1209926 RepID=A0A1G4AVI0_9PEZI|nr:hypothetical protein CORC01_11533 [Colletotrichum orchidophilum]
MASETAPNSSLEGFELTRVLGRG